jgi:hypothetical protein
MAGKKLNQPIVGMAATADGGGYWLVAADGGIFTFGDAPFHGSTGSLHLNQPIVGMAATPDGGGYWLVGADGGIFSFGNAQFYGSTGSLHLNQPVVGMATDGATGGYWLVASDGGLFAFHAPFVGSMGGNILNAPIHFVTGTADFGGYRMVGSDGGVFDFGDAQYYGSAAAPGSNGWSALAATFDGAGYWLFASTSGGSGVTVDAFGDASSSLGLVAGDSTPSPIVGAASLTTQMAPVITTQPMDQTAMAGSMVTITASATGSPAPSVQWQSSGDHGVSYVALPGYTSDTLSFTAAQFENGAELRAVFSNAAGSATTVAALLTVIPAGDTIPSSSGGYFLDASCGSSTECIAVGGTHSGLALIERSTDGGTTFTTSYVPSGAPEMTSVDCNDPFHCVAVGSSSALYSTDGGITWMLGTVPVPAPVSGVTISYILSGAACENDTVCVAVGTETISGTISVQSSIFIHSTDGGQTWTNNTAPSPNLVASVMCAPSFCIAVGEESFQSVDGGVTWNEHPNGVGAAKDVACTTDQTSCLIVGPNASGVSMPTAAGFLSISATHGQSWVPSSANLPASTANIESVGCGGTTDCMIVGPSPTTGGALVVLTSVDSGGHWTSLTGPTGYDSTPLSGVQGFYPWPNVACISSTACIVVGSSSSGPLVSRTSNAGQSWVSAAVQ